MSYCFRKAMPGEEKIVYSMIAARVIWMDEQGIKQWNATDYLNEYPLAYYQENLDHLFVLENETSGEIECAAIIFEQDDRWDAVEPAFYIHNFVSVLETKNIGKTFISELGKYARKQGKMYLRLDSADDNEKLAKYYDALGFVACGMCEDGDYHGILRQNAFKRKSDLK